jgi:sporulation protein YlmC with PRC-barrel domain
VEGTATVEGEDISAENLIGTAIYSPEEETVGEVGDVILGQDGAIEAVVVDVGGFLGVGEKPVAIQFDALNVQKDTNGDLRLMVNATQEQLENAPSYEAEEATAQ